MDISSKTAAKDKNDPENNSTNQTAQPNVVASDQGALSGRLAAPSAPQAVNLLAVSPKSSRKWLLYAAMLLALVIAASFAYYHHNQQVKQEKTYQADKATFAQVENDMKAAYTAIVANVGKPDVEQKYQDCSRVSRKYEQGDLSCGNAYGFAYTTIDYTAALSRLKSVQTSLRNSQLFTVDSMVPSFDILEANKLMAKSSDMRLGSGHVQIDCSLSFNYGPTTSSIENITAKGQFTGNYIFKCQKNMSQPIYPLAK